ncbi:hypothetical protein FRX31_005959 [Thalictrum thalictroides]|uniref:Uncharacterized protein n=1 Tax=Thalictrum thalictroides TaxID=46969 RepID=A0A7J6X465_THATH|nr:hypothetical protein FRX31_005959 [Thalictrum thalictroides]
MKESLYGDEICALIDFPSIRNKNFHRYKILGKFVSGVKDLEVCRMLGNGISRQMCCKCMVINLIWVSNDYNWLRISLPCEIDFEAVVKLTEGFNVVKHRNVCIEAGMLLTVLSVNMSSKKFFEGGLKCITLSFPAYMLSFSLPEIRSCWDRVKNQVVVVCS